MAELHETDAMLCRSSGSEEQASEGYQCATCGAFICVMRSIRGVLRCRNCADEEVAETALRSLPEVPLIDWPEH